MPKIGSMTVADETGAADKKQQVESAQREVKAARETAKGMVEAAEKGLRDAKSRGN